MYMYIHIYIYIYIYIFLGRSHKNMNTIFRPVNPVLDRNIFIFKVTVSMKRADYESNTVVYSWLPRR